MDSLGVLFGIVCQLAQRLYRGCAAVALRQVCEEESARSPHDLECFASRHVSRRLSATYSAALKPMKGGHQGPSTARHPAVPRRVVGDTGIRWFKMRCRAEPVSGLWLCINCHTHICVDVISNLLITPWCIWLTSEVGPLDGSLVIDPVRVTTSGQSSRITAGTNHWEIQGTPIV